LPCSGERTRGEGGGGDGVVGPDLFAHGTSLEGAPGVVAGGVGGSTDHVFGFDFTLQYGAAAQGYV
jgi:hypothetical protein